MAEIKLSLALVMIVEYTNATNLVSNTGVVSSDQTGVGTARNELAATGYGGDKAMFGFGYSTIGNTNLTI